MAFSIEFDETRFASKKGDYQTGPASALFDPLLHARAQEYRRRLSGQMRPFSGDDIFRIPRAKGYYAARKYDGEFTLLAFNGSDIISVNPGGTVRTGLPCYREAAELLARASVKSCLLGAEIYVNSDSKERRRVHHVIKILRSPKSEEHLESLALAVFDILELDGNAVPATADVFKKMETVFASGERVHPAEYRLLDSLEEIRDLYNRWVIEEGAEGLVIRHDQAGWFKVKPRHNLDAAIIGFSEGSDDRKGLLHDLLVAVMRSDGSFHELCRVGGGFTDDDRRILAEQLNQRVVKSEYVAVSSDYVAYEMIAPGPVIEISCLDLISENTRGTPINRMVLDWNDERYAPLKRMPLVSVISPQFVRIRDDKEANIEDVNISQIANLVNVPDADRTAHETAAPPSEIIRRVVYTKNLKGQQMVRKLLLWKTNKEQQNEFPGFVVYLTDFSPNRQNPLEREVKVADSEDVARELFDQLADQKFVGGWVKV